MHDAVASLDWAQVGTTQCAAAGVQWNIQYCFTAVDAAWLHHKNFIHAWKAVRQPRPVANDIQVLLINWQSMYGRPRTPDSSSSAPNRAKPYHNELHKRRWYICGRTDRLIEECTSFIWLKINVSRLLRKYKSCVSSIMFEWYTWARDTLAKKNDHTDTSQQNRDCDSDDYLAHVPEHFSEKKHQGSTWDESTLQQTFFSTNS